MNGPINSMTTRVQPVFGWLKEHGEKDWPERLVEMAEGTTGLSNCGSFLCMETLDPENKVPATATRLRWMIEKVHQLTPKDVRRWRELLDRVGDDQARGRALEFLKEGKPIPRKLILEEDTHSDCLIECEHALISIEGKRFDWLAPSITWDTTRAQLARNVEAVWSLAEAPGKE